MSEIARTIALASDELSALTGKAAVKFLQEYTGDIGVNWHAVNELSAFRLSQNQLSRVEQGLGAPQLIHSVIRQPNGARLLKPTIEFNELARSEGIRFAQTRESFVSVGLGTGFWTEPGLIATNAHVAPSYSGLGTVRFADGQELLGRLVARSLVDDLALIELRTKMPVRGALDLASSSQLSKADALSIIGHPERVPDRVLASGDYSDHILSNESRVWFDSRLGKETRRWVNEGKNGQALPVFLDTSAPVWPGFSGSPILKDSSVMGIAGYGPKHLAQGTVVEHLHTLLDVLKKEGTPNEGWLDIITNGHLPQTEGSPLSIEVVDITRRLPSKYVLEPSAL
jgi:S1-C subfamily serine protease